MKSIVAAAFCAAIATTAYPAYAACGDRASGESMIVSAAWLQSHAKDPNLVVIAMGDRGEYAAGHISGSIFLDYMDTHSMEPTGGLTLELLPMPDLERAFAKVGVSNDSRIVLYFTSNQYSPTTRVFLTLDAMGLGAQSSILDGGLPAWKAGGHSVTKEVPAVSPGKLKACPRPEVIADLDYVKSHMHSDTVRIVDARDPEYYTGKKQPSGKRLGHVPGAANLTYSTFFDAQGKFLPRPAMTTMFANAGIAPGKQVVSYCHIGQQATVVYFVARYLGYDARMFDGSWEEWSRHTELPAEVSVKQ
jgi:thiosulfate/3-mercaptopyruvate sulfurtransferase